MVSTLVYLALSGFIIWFVQAQKIFDYIFRTQFLKELRSCGICLGFWVCFALFPIFDLIKFQNLYQYILSWAILSALASVLILLVKEGYHSRYGVTVIR
jgi:hypothetical protein